jgi:hypothetical protein
VPRHAGAGDPPTSRRFARLRAVANESPLWLNLAESARCGEQSTITATKVANHSLTGLQLDASRLGTIPSAVHALRADNAAKAGHAISADAATNALIAGNAANGGRRIEFDGLPVDPAPVNPFFSPASNTLLTLDELTVKASCIDAGSGTARVYVTFTSSASAFLNFDSLTFENPTTTPNVGGVQVHPRADVHDGRPHRARPR